MTMLFPCVRRTNMSNKTTGNVIHSDLKRVIAMTDDDIVYDEDCPPGDDALWDNAVLKVGNRPVGRPVSNNPKIATTVRLSPEVVAYFKAGGKGWQTRLDSVLREYVANH